MKVGDIVIAVEGQERDGSAGVKFGGTTGTTQRVRGSLLTADRSRLAAL